jgi:hypothetical protein
VEIKIKGNSQSNGTEVQACPSSQAYVAKQDLTLRSLGRSTKTLDCSTSFGTYMIWVTVGVGLAVGGIWSKFDRR